MSAVVDQTPNGRDHMPDEGCQFRCVTCGNSLRGRREVRGHWAICNRGHSVFVDRKGRAYHQTVEGLHRRDWHVATPDDEATDSLPNGKVDAVVDVSAACNYSELDDGTLVTEPFVSLGDGESLPDVRGSVHDTLVSLERPPGTLGLEVSGEDPTSNLIFVRVHTATPAAMAAILRELASQGFCTGLN